MRPVPTLPPKALSSSLPPRSRASEPANQTISLPDQHYILTNCDIYVLSQQNDAHRIGSNDWRTGQGPLFSRGPRGPNSRISAEKS